MSEESDMNTMPIQATVKAKERGRKSSHKNHSLLYFPTPLRTMSGFAVEK